MSARNVLLGYRIQRNGEVLWEQDKQRITASYAIMPTTIGTIWPNKLHNQLQSLCPGNLANLSSSAAQRTSFVGFYKESSEKGYIKPNARLFGYGIETQRRPMNAYVPTAGYTSKDWEMIIISYRQRNTPMIYAHSELQILKPAIGPCVLNMN